MLCGITAFYEFLAKQLGFGEKVYAENTLFDCKAVEVSKSVFENIRSYYEAEYLDKFKRKMDLLNLSEPFGFGMARKQRFLTKDMLLL